ncbi:RBR-type E3 ubiquitin transferase [Aphelenchoides bicaudatus]|nr:RBR-type E3 ubiquitin transferase [Aphelenchoides bicaudatus]
MDYEDDPMYSDNDSDEEIHEIAVEHDNKQHKFDVDYELLDHRDLLKELDVLVSDTSAVIGFSSGICKILLHKFNWNKEFLIEKFYEFNDKDKFLRESNVVEAKDASDKGRVETCQICFEEFKLTGLSCKHMYCLNCWKNYLGVKILDECLWQIPCPGLKCTRVLDEEFVERLSQSKQVMEVFHKQVLNSFVQSSTVLKWCPGVDCGYVAKVPHPECRAIVCKCRMVFCFMCSQEWHQPVDCVMLKKWLKKCNDDSETSNWLNANTKDCPQCHVTIEKDGGCNHMTCKNVSCRFEFCWTCLGPWKPHGSGWYSCNRFDDTDAKKARDEQERSRAALQRYLHYYNRFMNHKNSLKLEKKLNTQVEEKMKQLQQMDFSWIETQSVSKAVGVLNECRRTLMYTYAFAFYLEKSNQATIFENNQNDLELATEQLSELLEKELDTEKDKLKTWKQVVQDKYRYLASRRTALLKHVEDGNEKHEWVFNTKI